MLLLREAVGERRPEDQRQRLCAGHQHQRRRCQLDVVETVFREVEDGAAEHGHRGRGQRGQAEDDQQLPVAPEGAERVPQAPGKRPRGPGGADRYVRDGAHADAEDDQVDGGESERGVGEPWRRRFRGALFEKVDRRQRDNNASGRTEEDAQAGYVGAFEAAVGHQRQHGVVGHIHDGIGGAECQQRRQQIRVPPFQRHVAGVEERHEHQRGQRRADEEERRRCGQGPAQAVRRDAHQGIGDTVPDQRYQQDEAGQAG